MEEWKFIKGWPGYEVSNYGQVKSYRKPTSPKLLKPQWNGRYFHVVLHNNGNKKTILIHKLVLNAFIGECPLGMEACHNDGNPLNNYFTNLRWDYHKNNILDKHIHGSMAIGEQNGNSKLTEEQVNKIKELDISIKEIANEFNVSRQTVHSIRHNKTWKYL